MIRELRDRWDQPDGPKVDPPPILAGGGSDPAIARVALHADGYVHGGGPPRSFARVVERVRAAWRDAARPGEPMLWGQGYVALGDDAPERGLAYMRDYYAFTGPFAEKIAAGLLTTPQDVAAFLRGYADLGCQEMVLLPAVAELEQVGRLQDVLGSLP
jgi:alkanesulfonate monooxygenase SsuD/methylene tetrahydromethanopterin reductase-like flavin-dependent oxidoreductase (luciferase family)